MFLCGKKKHSQKKFRQFLSENKKTVLNLKSFNIIIYPTKIPDMHSGACSHQ